MLRFTVNTLPFVIAFLQATVGFASSTSGRNLRGNRNNDKKPLCFNLDKKKYGQYGMQTVNVPQENVRWFLRDDEVVSKGPCDSRQVETLSNRQTKALEFCTQIGTTTYDITAPRFLDSYLYERDAERGECVKEIQADKMVANSGQPESDSNNKLLCFDLRKNKMGGFGKQTVEVTAESTRWFLKADEVTKGACEGDSEDLDKRELSTLKYCAHRGPITSGYEVELKAPRFLDDYLFEKSGVERGGCRDSKTDAIQAKLVTKFNVDNSEKKGKVKENSFKLKFKSGKGRRGTTLP